MSKAKMATVWLDGCSGCHMSFLDIDERLIAVAELADLVYSPLVDTKDFPEMADVTLIEGAVSSEEDFELSIQCHYRIDSAVTICIDGYDQRTQRQRNTAQRK